MFYKLGPKLILSLAVLIVAIKEPAGRDHGHGCQPAFPEHRHATWNAMLDDRHESAYEIMQVIADKQGLDRIRMFNCEGKLMFSTDPRERPSILLVHDEVCASCHDRSAPRPSLAGALRHVA